MLDSQIYAQKYPFNYESEFVKNYFGAEKQVQVNYHEFTQLITVSEKSFFFFLVSKKSFYFLLKCPIALKIKTPIS